MYESLYVAVNVYSIKTTVFSARCYAERGYATVGRLSVRPLR